MEMKTSWSSIYLKLIKSSVFFIVIFYLTSCGKFKNKKDEQKNIETFFTPKNISPTSERYIINLLHNFVIWENSIPNSPQVVFIQAKWSCHACKDLLSDFIKKNYKNQNLKFILPIFSKKELKLHFNNSILNSKNIYIDAEDFFIKNEIVLLESKIFYINNSKIQKIVTININNMEKEISSKTIKSFFTKNKI